MNSHLSDKTTNLFILLLISCSLSVKGAKVNFTSDYGRQIIQTAKSADIKSLMKDVDPCEDFYTYACGKWHNINAAQLNGKINTDKFQTLTQGFQQRLKNLLLTKRTENNEVEDKIKDFYNSCLHAKEDKEEYRKSLADIYKEFGEFSMQKAEETPKQQTTYSWWSTVAKIQYKYGKSIMLSVYILDDLKDKSKTMAYIGPPEFELTQMAFDIRDKQKESIGKYLQLYLNIAPEVAAKTAQNVVTFKHNLVRGITSVRQGKSIEGLLTLYNTNDLFKKYQDLFDAKEYLEIVLGTKELPELVYVYNESYLEGLYDVLNSTDSKHIEDYIMWQFLEEYIIDINSSDLDEQCIEKTKKYFGKFVDHTIYTQYRSNETEAEISELWVNIKGTFRDNMQNDKYYWLSDATREEAIKKLDNMNLTINSYDNEDFTEQFKNLVIDSTTYVSNVQSILTHAESLRENKLEKKSEEDAQLLSFTPVYNIMTNQIKIPVTLLQPFYVWDTNYPKAIIYGTLGFIIAHEMIHGFDDKGRNYDASGSSNNWWDEKSIYEFESRRKCFQEQYHKYKYNGKFLTESAMQSENIADNGGLNIAYDAYERWLEKHKTPESQLEESDILPRLNFNNRQLFFISFAQLWCEDVYPLFRSSFLDADTHAPTMYRVIGSLSNSRQFSWIFKCYKKNSTMDPPKKCEIY